MAAIARLTAHQTLLQMNALRIAAWGDAEDVARFRAALLDDGAPASGDDDIAAALAAFGLRATP